MDLNPSISISVDAIPEAECFAFARYIAEILDERRNAILRGLIDEIGWKNEIQMNLVETVR
jgi:hypothetical protein